MSNRSGGPGPPLFSVFCFSKRPPARHPEVARPPTDPEIKKRRPWTAHLESRVPGTTFGTLREIRHGFTPALLRGGAGLIAASRAPASGPRM